MGQSSMGSAFEESTPGGRVVGESFGILGDPFGSVHVRELTGESTVIVVKRSFWKHPFTRGRFLSH